MRKEKMEKRTRAELFNEVVVALRSNGEDTLAEFVEKELKNLKARAEKETPAQKENRALREKLVADVLSAKPISIKDIQGCYTAKVTKSVVLRLKDAKREINIT